MGATLDGTLAAEHAINVHASAEDIQTYIACDDVTGTPTDDELHIDLQELKGSGFSGEAHLVGNGDGTTIVTVSPRASTGATPQAPRPTNRGTLHDPARGTRRVPAAWRRAYLMRMRVWLGSTHRPG